MKGTCSGVQLVVKYWFLIQEKKHAVWAPKLDALGWILRSDKWLMWSYIRWTNGNRLQAQEGIFVFTSSTTRLDLNKLHN